MAEVWRVAIEMHRPSDNQDLASILHYTSDEGVGVGAPTPVDVATDVWAHIGTTFRAALRNDVTVDQVKVTQELAPDDPSPPPQGVFAVNAVGTLSLGDAKLPIWYTAKIAKKTGAAVRSGHGWLLMPLSANSAHLTAERIDLTTAYFTALTNLCGTLDDQFSVGTVIVHNYKPVVYSRTRRARGDADYWFNITSCVFSPRPAMLRSRAD